MKVKDFSPYWKQEKGPCQLDSIHGSVLVLEYLGYQQHLTFTEHLLSSRHYASHSMTIKSFNIPQTKMIITRIMLSFQHISQMWRLKGVSISLTYTASDEGGHNLNFTLLCPTVPHTCPRHTLIRAPMVFSKSDAPSNLQLVKYANIDPSYIFPPWFSFIL